VIAFAEGVLVTHLIFTVSSEKEAGERAEEGWEWHPILLVRKVIYPRPQKGLTPR
jgi:hypothetical protein